jgi:hypothetical protein
VKRNPKGAKSRRQTIQVWSYAQAQAAVPYLASVIRSLREHRLEALAARRTAQRLAGKPGRPNRNDLIAQQEADRKAHEAEGHLQDAAAELQALDVYSLDPVQGLAMVPFVYNGQLAWFIFDLYDPKPFCFWRFQSDPEETRRPVTSMQQDLPEAETPQIV